MTIAKCAWATVFVVFSFASANSENAPAGLLNKTITISFVASGTSKFPDGHTINFNTSITRTIYVSSAGRLFMRNVVASANGRRSASGDFGPDDTGASEGYHPGRGTFAFQATSLLA
jgi:hypothetical protein